MNREVFTRRNLPHWFKPGACHFVTFRLAGTLPRAVLDGMKDRKRRLLQQVPPAGWTVGQHRYHVHKLLFADYDAYLDRNREIDWLARPSVAALVRRSLHHLRGAKYELFAYCIMPNHVHMLILPHDAPARCSSDLDTCAVGEQEDRHSPLSGIMHTLKSFTAHEANRMLGRKGRFWQHESYDHWVRDEDELERIVAYINANAVTAGLAAQPHDWLWSSAHDRFLLDANPSGWLPAEQ